MELEIGYRRMFYGVVGDGEPILFIHGFPLSGLMWQPTVERIAGWRCIVPDLRGHGQSEPSEQASIEDFTDDLVGLLDASGEERPVVVCGLSIGGIIAFDFFRRYRMRTRALVLVDCRPTPESEDGKEQREKLAQAALRNGGRVAADAMVDKLFAPTTDKTLKRHWHAVMAATPPVGVAATARALAARADSQPTLPQIDVPTLLVFGEEDAITPPDIGRQMQARIPGAQFDLIPGAGHLPPVEQPDRFADGLRSFLTALPRLK